MCNGLTEDQIEEIATTAARAVLSEPHKCRFGDLDPQVVTAAVEYFEQRTAAMTGAKVHIIKLIVTSAYFGALALLWLGLKEKIKAIFGIV